MAITDYPLHERRSLAASLSQAFGYQGSRYDGLFARQPTPPKPHLLSPAGRFAVLCLLAMFVGAAAGFAT